MKSDVIDGVTMGDWYEQVLVETGNMELGENLDERTDYNETPDEAKLKLKEKRK